MSAATSNDTPLTLGDPLWISWRLEETQASRAYRRYAERLSHLELEPRVRHLLLAILLVEMSARSGTCRAVEWILAFLARTFRIRCVMRRPRTLGPFQMQNAPFHFEQAVAKAASLIERQPREVESIARFWHGVAQRERGARVGYATALQIAMSKVGMSACENERQVRPGSGRETRVKS
jgi:hypothetical protein